MGYRATQIPIHNLDPRHERDCPSAKRSAVVALLLLLLLLLLSSFDEPARFIDHLQKIHMHTPPN
jgi:hypothetical protein